MFCDKRFIQAHHKKNTKYVIKMKNLNKEMNLTVVKLVARLYLPNFSFCDNEFEKEHFSFSNEKKNLIW